MKPIELEHPDYTARKHVWRRYRDLYVGGEQLKANAAEYLMRRQKEPFGVWGERLERVYYENFVGSIVDWYVATLFRREPLLLTEGEDRRGTTFFHEFAEDCDLRGTTITDFFRKQVLEALVTGSSYTLADFPRAWPLPENLAEEDRAGASRAYLTPCQAENLINWSLDEHGGYEWVVLRNTYLRKPGVDSEKWTRETRWIYYDREHFQVWKREGDVFGQESVVMVDEGCHSFSKVKQVPLFPLRLDDGLWLMNRAALLQLEHFNKSNALSWALTQGLFAMPVVYSERDWNQIVGDSYYIQLGPNDRFGWTEPEGRVFSIAAQNLDRLKEEIYRVCYVLSQAGGPVSTGVTSGVAKQRDFAITQEMLRALGDQVKDTMKRVMRSIAAVREDGVTIDVSGLDEFDIGDFTNELADAKELLAMGVDSPTLKRQVLKKLAFKYLCDVRQELKDRIGREIDEAVQPLER